MSGVVGDGLTPFGLATDDATEVVEVLLGRNRCEGPAATEGDRGFTFFGALAAMLVVEAAEAAERVLCRG
jgi:hypothetical protein